MSPSQKLRVALRKAPEMRRMLTHATSVLSKLTIGAGITQNAQGTSVTSAQQVVREMLRRGPTYFPGMFGLPIGGEHL